MLYLALDLGQKSWKLAFTVGLGQKPRLRTIAARDIEALLAEIRAAKGRFGLAEDATVVACYEAGRDGFWLKRCLLSHGVECIIVDSASIEVNRRKRRSKSDRLDAIKLVEMLIRWHNGESKVWSVVRAPSAEDEDARQMHRELIALRGERTAHVNAIKGMLAGLGLVAGVDERLPGRLAAMRQWDGKPIPQGVLRRILREHERWRLVGRQIAELEAQRRAKIRDDATPHVEKVRVLLGLKGIGENGAWLLVEELFGWRQIRNRRELGSLAGLAPTPYASGESPPRAGDQQGGQPPGPLDDGAAGMVLAEVSAGQRAEPMVRGAVRGGERAVAEGGDRGAVAEAAGGAVEVRGEGGGAGGGGGGGLGEEVAREGGEGPPRREGRRKAS